MGFKVVSQSTSRVERQQKTENFIQHAFDAINLHWKLFCPSLGSYDNLSTFQLKNDIERQTNKARNMNVKVELCFVSLHVEYEAKED